jgi:hypothetical protein
MLQVGATGINNQPPPYHRIQVSIYTELENYAACIMAVRYVDHLTRMV